MLTKTRKWILVFILAFVALFLVACDEEEPDPEIKPEDLTVEIVAFVGNKATVVGKAPMKVVVTSTTANANLGVNWTSSDDAIAIVDAEGIVSGKKAGYATITATSKLDDTVKDSVEIRVYDSQDHINNDLKALLDASEALQAAMPEFVDKTMDLPKPANAAMDVVYKNQHDEIMVGGKYTYGAYTNDRYETINVEMSFGTEKMAFPYQLRIVDDVVDNDFNAIAEAQEFIDKYLKIYKGELKVFGDITFPKSVKELKTLFDLDHTGRDVAISWKSTNTTIITNAGEYIRPNDDTVVTLEAYFVSNNISAVSRHPITVKGYSQDELIEYIFNTIPKTIQAQNLVLPTYFAKFGATLTWATDDAEAIAATGKANPYLAEETDVTLTATIKYAGTTSAAFAFEKDASIVVKAIPADNDSQAVALDLANRFETELPAHFPHGVIGREGGNTYPLPTTVGGDGEFKDVALTWTVSEEGLFNASWVLQKQYLRYHPVTLTFSVTVGDNTSTGEVAVNTGVAKMANTIYAGANMYSRLASQAQPYDALHQFAGVDQVSGISNSNLNVYGWSGITYYTDYVDEDSGLVTRWQFFASNLYSIKLDDLTKLTLNPNDVVIGGAKRGNGTLANNNRQYTIVNNTDKALGVPFFTTDAAYLAKTTLLDKDMGGQANAQDNLNISGLHTGFVVDAAGKVIMGFGTTSMQAGIIAANNELEEPAATLPNAIMIPAGGFAYTARFASPAALTAKFAVVDRNVVLEQYTSVTMP